jgi:hypothetical protein
MERTASALDLLLAAVVDGGEERPPRACAVAGHGAPPEHLDGPRARCTRHRRGGSQSSGSGEERLGSSPDPREEMRKGAVARRRSPPAAAQGLVEKGRREMS